MSFQEKCIFRKNEIKDLRKMDMEGIWKQQCSTKTVYTLYDKEDGNDSRDIDKYFVVIMNWRNNI